MKQMLHCIWLGLVLSFVTMPGLAQQIAKLSEDTIPSAPSQLLMSSSRADDSLSSENSSIFSLAPGGATLANASIAPVPPAHRKIADKKFLLLNGLSLGMAVFDVEMTQQCIASHRCVEKNPLMPSSHAGQLGLNLALVSGASWFSYHQKEHNSKVWWLPPVMGSVVHGVGVATGFKHQ